MPIPTEIEKNITTLSKEQWDIEKEKIVSKSLKFYNERIDKNEQLKKLINEKLNKKVVEPVNQQINDNTIMAFIEKKDYYIDKRKTEITNLLNNNTNLLN